jgi:hypothetical protein
MPPSTAVADPAVLFDSKSVETATDQTWVGVTVTSESAPQPALGDGARHIAVSLGTPGLIADPEGLTLSITAYRYGSEPTEAESVQMHVTARDVERLFRCVTNVVERARLVGLVLGSERADRGAERATRAPTADVA